MKERRARGLMIAATAMAFAVYNSFAVSCPVSVAFPIRLTNLLVPFAVLDGVS